MINRIVKLTFRPEAVNQFKKIFEDSKNLIAAFEGCDGVTLLQDKVDSRIFFTYSLWQDEEALERYRKSELFKNTWKQTKALFDKKAEAWSVKLISIAPESV